MALNTKDLAIIRELIEMMKEHKVDLIEIDKIKIVKGYHEMSIPTATTNNNDTRTEQEITDELLFHSAN